MNLKAFWRKVYAGWLDLAEKLNHVVITVLFTALYFAVVPWFFLASLFKDPLSLRTLPSEKTYWLRRRPVPLDQSFFERLG